MVLIMIFSLGNRLTVASVEPHNVFCVENAYAEAGWSLFNIYGE